MNDAIGVQQLGAHFERGGADTAAAPAEAQGKADQLRKRIFHQGFRGVLDG